MKTGCFLSTFIDTVDAKVCIFNLQSISQAERRGLPTSVAPERALRSRAGNEHDFYLVNCAILIGVLSRKRQGTKSGLSDEEVRDILVRAMADVGADPALVYAFQKTGVYVCEENAKRLSTAELKAFDRAVDEYFAAVRRPLQ
jgi:hypothetical protein